MLDDLLRIAYELATLIGVQTRPGNLHPILQLFGVRNHDLDVLQQFEVRVHHIYLQSLYFFLILPVLRIGLL